MPPQMNFSPRNRSPFPPGGGIENNNKLGNRPSVRQSKLYREKESGNAMKSLFGQDNLAWKTEEQEGVFSGQSVFNASTGEKTASPPRATGAPPAEPTVFGGGGGYNQCAPCGDEIPYPNPGCVASCDACDQVVNRFYHCLDCPESTGLMDLCTECCAAIYLKQGTPRALARMVIPNHPTHVYASHRMMKVAPPGQ